MSWLDLLQTVIDNLRDGFERREQPIQNSNDHRMRPLTRDDVIKMIQQNGGSEGLDLSKCDLSGADLRNLSLRGVIFGRCDFVTTGYGANLVGATFTDSDLTRANLTHTNLQDAGFWEANLYEASLFAAQAQNAHFGRADLRRADLYGCQLGGANLWYARLEEANLATARLADALVTGVQLGDFLLQEKQKDYEEYFERWYARDLPAKYRERHLKLRYHEATEIYMNLKNAYLSHGRYKEASRAYINERLSRRATCAPWRAKAYYSTEWNSSILRKLWFYPKYFVTWILDWLADLLCGYGEKPLRTVLWAGVILLAFPLLFALSGGVVSRSGQMTWLDYLNYSLGTFTTIGFSQFEAQTPLAQVLTSIEALLGISTLALLMFTLGNRISRS
ncbi:MAG: pentapeptide repeat-containing protein [Chloroflexi bacterium]|nr:pentapeptide repeat-containing protein [Chloroflexota bacterium]